MVKFEELEIWDTIPGYNNYKVSSKGRVFSIRRDKIMKTFLRKNGYYHIGLRKDGQQNNFLVHRLVALTFYFVEDNTLQIDHKDRDKANNNLLNLRFCSNSENKRNTGIQKNNTSGFKGVSYHKTGQKWEARIKINGKTKWIGSFNTKEEAYESYKKASKELHGEYSYTP